MSSRNRVKRRDDNQSRIAAFLQDLGALVQDTSQVGDGFPDLVAGHRGRLVLLEVKNPEGAGDRMTDDEVDFHQLWRDAMGLPVYIVRTNDEAAAALGIEIVGGAT